MRIAQIAPLYERVPPLLYGGTERVVSYVTEELVRRGHEVTLFASGDSLTAARLEATCPRGLRLDPSTRDPLASHFYMLAMAYRQARAFDVVHSHVDYMCLPFARGVSTPTLLTLHGRLDMPELAPLYAEYADIPLVSISNAQRAPLADAHWVDTIHHGLPLDLNTFNPQPRDHLLFLGRISPEKCPDVAIRVAIAAGVPLRLVAKVDPVDRDYFETRVRPLLDHPLIEFVGEVGDRDKDALLGAARGLLFPIDWPEPFGLVMIEALACGTPVIARRRGSVPEVIRHGETGFVCDTEEEMVEAVRRLGTIDRSHCRTVFERDFSVATMTDRYVAVYEQLHRGAGLLLPATPTAARPAPGAAEPRDDDARVGASERAEPSGDPPGDTA